MDTIRPGAAVTSHRVVTMGVPAIRRGGDMIWHKKRDQRLSRRALAQNLSLQALVKLKEGYRLT